MRPITVVLASLASLACAGGRVKTLLATVCKSESLAETKPSSNDFVGRSSPEKAFATLLLAVDPPVAWYGCGIVVKNPVANLEVLRYSLSRIAYPDKGMLRQHAATLGKYRAASGSLPNYRFTWSGSLFTGRSGHVSDVDMIWYATDNRTRIPLEDFQNLCEYALQYLAVARIPISVKLQARGKELYCGRPDAFGVQEIRDLFDTLPVELAVISIAYEIPVGYDKGWLVPMDLALSCTETGGSSQRLERANRFVKNLLCGNYAKGYGRFRGMFESSRKRGEIGGEWSRAGSKLRFVVKQLRMLQDLQSCARKDAAGWKGYIHKYLTERLFLPMTGEVHEDLALWLELAESEMQRCGRLLLLKFLRLFSLGGNSNAAQLLELVEEDERLEGINLQTFANQLLDATPNTVRPDSAIVDCVDPSDAAAAIAEVTVAVVEAEDESKDSTK